jgi:hypothetical protein
LLNNKKSYKETVLLLSFGGFCLTSASMAALHVAPMDSSPLDVYFFARINLGVEQWRAKEGQGKGCGTETKFMKSCDKGITN